MRCRHPAGTDLNGDSSLTTLREFVSPYPDPREVKRKPRHSQFELDSGSCFAGTLERPFWARDNRGRGQSTIEFVVGTLLQLNPVPKLALASWPRHGQNLFSPPNVKGGRRNAGSTPTHCWRAKHSRPLSR